MSKYDGLGNYLRRQGFAEIPMTFAEIERVTGVKLPPKAQHHRAWWSNNPSNNVMTQVWLGAGYESTQVDMAARKLVFRRLARGVNGVTDPAQTTPVIRARSSGSGAAKQKHALIGALRGT